MNIPCLHLATSIIRIYLKLPKSFEPIGKIISQLAYFLQYNITYILNKICTFLFWRMLNKQCIMCLTLHIATFLENTISLSNHVLRDCFNPYNVFFILYTLLLAEGNSRVGVVSMCASSSKSSLYRKMHPLHQAAEDDKLNF